MARSGDLDVGKDRSGNRNSRSQSPLQLGLDLSLLI